MIGLQFIDDEQELLPTCMPLPSGVYAVEATENVLFEPIPKAVHLFSRGGNDSMVLFYWEMVTPFGAFDVKYLRAEYPGKLFRVLSTEGIFLVRVPGEDREVSTIATSPTPATTLPYPTTTSALPPTPIVVTSTPVLTLPSTTRSVLTSHTNLTTSNRPSITTTTTTTTTTTVKASTSSVWTSETVPPLAGLTFCLAVMLVLYARRVWWPVDWCCCVTRLHRRLERRRIDHQVRRNEDIELTSLDTSSETSVTTSSTVTTEDACHDEGFVNVSLEDD